METKSKTETIAENHYNLLSKITNASDKCRRQYMMPKEVWLGPKEREIMAAKWMSEKMDLSCYLPNHFPFDETIESLMEKLRGSQIYGLNIRFAEEDGVWVGVSFEGESV